MSKTYKINEIFYSLQGEGFHTGRPAVFVRFAGCNLHCDFCDTDFHAYESLSVSQIVERVKQVCPCVSSALLVFTGGEPTLQVNQELCDALHALGMYLCIETNGTNPVPSCIDWVTVSPKQGTEVKQLQASELKVVYVGQDVEHWASLIRAEHLYLQPCSGLNSKETVAYILAHPHWRLSVQTHKYLQFP